MTRLLTLLIFLHLTFATRAQYPFEKYSAVKSKVYFNWKSIDELDNKGKINHTLSVPDFFSDHETLTIQVTGFKDFIDSSCIRIFSNMKLLKKYADNLSLGIGGFNYPDSAYVGDFNGDGLTDIKFYIPNHGCGAYNFYAQAIYFFQKQNKTFDRISFTDLFLEFNYRKERDIDGDGNYEIITQTFKSFGNHNYWLFNIYKYSNGKFVNVNYLDNYPIMIQILNRENYAITNKVPLKKMKEFTRKLPDDYDRK